MAAATIAPAHTQTEGKGSAAATASSFLMLEAPSICECPAGLLTVPK